MRLSFFPFVPEVEVLLRNRPALSKHEIFSIVSFKEDAAKLTQLKNTFSVLCTDAIELGLSQTELLVLLKPNFEPEWEKYYQCIKFAAENGIQMYGDYQLIHALPAEEYRTLIRPFQSQSSFTMMPLKGQKLLKTSIPIIAVAGLGENCGKFECELELKQYIDKAGYKCAALSSNPLGIYAGMKLLPETLFESSMSFPQKVFALNRYVYTLCMEEQPDVLIVGIPGGVIPLSDNDVNFFLELPLVISSALQIDAAILAVYYANTSFDFLKGLAQICLNKFSLPVKAFYMSRQMIAIDPESESMQFLFLSDEYIKNHRNCIADVSTVGTPLKDNSIVYQRLVQTLKENIETV